MTLPLILLVRTGAILLVTSLVLGCTKPLAIAVEQAPAQIAIASTVIDTQTLLLTATRSISSLTNLNDGSQSPNPLGLVSGLLLSDATVVVRNGTHADTLSMLYPGLYGSYSLSLTPYQTYQLTVADNTNGTRVTSSATYLPMVTVDTLVPRVTRTTTDTTLSLHLVMQDDPNRNDYYLVSYGTISPASVPSVLSRAGFTALSADPTKTVELFTDADQVNGRIKRDITLTSNQSDTLYVHVGRIEKGYFDYLTAYKRTSTLLTQLTSEPITLPTNVVPGLGYFCLYEPKRFAFALRNF